MHAFEKERNQKLAQKVIKGLASRNMEGYYAETREEALKKALELIPEGSSVSWGGSMSVEEIGTGLEKAITEIELKGLTGTITWDASGSPSKEPKAVIIENGAYKSMED